MCWLLTISSLTQPSSTTHLKILSLSLRNGVEESCGVDDGVFRNELFANIRSTNKTSRIKLSDGRYLAYKERGVPKNESTYRVVIVHGFASNKEMNFMATQKLMGELGIYLVQFDRAGYGDSDPNPKRSLKSESSDIQELADQLQLGSKFYLIGVSIGSYPTWSCIKNIPERLAGVVMVVPFVNYRWPSLPRDLIQDDYRKKLSQWAVWVARHTPGLLHWWLTQKMFPSSSVLDRNPKFFSNKDLEVLKNTPGYQLLCKSKLKEEPIFDSLRKDFIVAFGKWDFDPLNMINPFGENQCRLHIWQGMKIKLCLLNYKGMFGKGCHGSSIMKFMMVAICLCMIVMYVKLC
ncbi:unnamed protein product [Lactuca virosa]|uniref:Serine aminopeptidase S33 domain-containing protein n=1 Tax=Lactuca virosa TaxID=75947 RepID=A0AAU9PSH2_9ASTR|nr:unnamed protein product [Lactuca virosa]